NIKKGANGFMEPLCCKKAILGTNKNINKSKTIEFNVRNLLHICIVLCYNVLESAIFIRKCN
ncbi:MAG: hypothetical protein L0J96_09755, partial [Lactococcus lactis]|nr:hypothetical protein [Lactococcus lactis]